jgi:uridine phosphorylase
MKVNRYNTGFIPASQLILRTDNSVYHLGVKGSDIADTVLVVGDPDRVPMISSRFDFIDRKISGREFVIHTGVYQSKPVTVLSTGIGVDNIDIVINELDAAVNVDPITRQVNNQLRTLSIIRLGTCGALREDVPIGTVVASTYAIGYDGVPWHYGGEMTSREAEVAARFELATNWPDLFAKAYCAECDEELLQRIGHDFEHGLTFTANGFYGPQNRSVRLPLRDDSMMDKLRTIECHGYRATNFEMECAGIYALASMLGHKALTCCVVLANRYAEQFTIDPEKEVNRLIDAVLERL